MQGPRSKRTQKLSGTIANIAASMVRDDQLSNPSFQRILHSMTMRNVVAIGHSHLAALISAYGNTRPQTESKYALTSYQFLRNDRSHIVHLDGVGWRYHPEIERDVLQLIDTVKPDVLAILLQGEQAALAGLISSVRPYDFYFPAETGYIPVAGTDIIPFSIVYEICKDRFRLVADFLDLIRPALPRHCVALSPPPIVGDRQFILDTKGTHREIAHQIEEYGLPTTTWRLRVWKVHMMALRAIYADRNIRFIDPPDTAYGTDGCLRAALRGDIFHANAMYGRLLMDQLDLLLQQQAR